METCIRADKRKGWKGRVGFKPGSDQGNRSEERGTWNKETRGHGEEEMKSVN